MIFKLYDNQDDNTDAVIANHPGIYTIVIYLRRSAFLSMILLSFVYIFLLHRALTSPPILQILNTASKQKRYKV